METLRPLYGIGDIHGDYDQLLKLLQSYSLTNQAGKWIGGNARLVCTGDLTDRGPNGYKVVAYMRELQRQAAEEGGLVECLLGNHDALIIARAMEHLGHKADDYCYLWFARNGGLEEDAEALARDSRLLEWLQDRPLMLLEEGFLFQHADSHYFYARYGKTVEEVNDAGRLRTKDAHQAYFLLFGDMTDARRWDHSPRTEWVQMIRMHLDIFGGAKVVHGHTKFVGTEPLVYADGLAMNIDGTMSRGYWDDPDETERGFVVKLL